MLNQEGKSIYLRLSSNDSTVKVSNSQYSVDLSTWPNELGRGVTGISLVSASFAQNVTNVTEHNNQFRWHSESSSSSYTIPVSHVTTMVITPKVEGFNYNAAVIHGGGVYTNATALAADLQTDYRAAYTTWHTQAGNVDYAAADISVTSSDGYHATISIDPDANYYVAFINYQLLLDVGFSEISLNTLLDFGTSSITTTTMPFTHLGTLPVGWYDYTTFSAAIVAAMSASTGGDVFTMAEDPLTQVSIITPVTNVGDVIKFLPRVQGTTANILLGLGEEEVHGPVVTMPYVGNLHGPQTLYIHSSKLTGHNSFDGDGAVISIAKAIPITAEYRGIQTFVNNDSGVPDHLMPRRKVFRKVNITLRDGDGHAVDIGAGNLQVKFRLYF